MKPTKGSQLYSLVMLKLKCFSSMAEIAATYISNLLFRHVLGNQENSWQDYGGLRFLHSYKSYFAFTLILLSGSRSRS